MKTSAFDYELPKELIAQTPLARRDQSRMLVCDRESGAFRHAFFIDFPNLLSPGDVLVTNRSRVIPARLLGTRKDGDIPCEVLLLRRLDRDTWEALVRPGRRLKAGALVLFGGGMLQCVVGEPTAFGGRVVRFSYEGAFEALLDTLGQMPLPPYIHQRLEDRGRYQTVYAKEEGSAAAPTAGLHFTREVLQRVRARGVTVVSLLLHVGLGTFRPVKAENVEDHVMHEEWFELDARTAETINAAREAGGRIVCVGTTCVRALESSADETGRLSPKSGPTGIFITPGYRFRAVDALLTNFHLPQSTLLMLVSAFMGRENALAAYREAVRNKYRFFSFGDCMFIAPGVAGDARNG